MDASAWIGIAALIVTSIGGFGGIVWRMGGLTKTVEYMGKQLEHFSATVEKEHGRIWDQLNRHEDHANKIRSELAMLKGQDQPRHRQRDDE